MNTDTLLNRLDKVRETGIGRWRAICPAHESKHGTQSLSIQEVGDRMLIKCFAGCGAAEVMEAVGLGLEDLFESTPDGPKRRSSVDWKMLCMNLREESYVLSIWANGLREGRKFTQNDLDRLEETAEKLREVLKHAGA